MGDLATEAGGRTEQIEFEAHITQAKMHLTDLKHQKGKLTGCTSYVQRKMQIGYNRAAAIMEELEKRKFISEPDKNGERFGVDC